MTFENGSMPSHKVGRRRCHSLRGWKRHHRNHKDAHSLKQTMRRAPHQAPHQKVKFKRIVS